MLKNREINLGPRNGKAGATLAPQSIAAARHFGCGYAAVVIALVSFASPARATEPKVDFNRDIRPIFSDTCFTCHGPDDAKRKSGLRLDLKDQAFKPAKSGKVAIVPGDPAKSEIIRRLTTTDEDDRMPPAKIGKIISPEQVAIVKKWIEQGAPYQGHWAFTPPVRPALPELKNKAWGRNEIDAFILAKLESAGLSPTAEADKHTLIRRVTLDLTGLPPTPEETAAFIADTSPTAYEKVVDRLLASPRYGERMAMNWLDGARYADSHGYQADWERYQWRWREWVIEAFNKNQPFDQFTIDQLAGDLRPNATLEQKLATGFHRNHRMNTEGGTIPEEWRTEYVIDRVDTTGMVWLGLTLGCARCHDHKYDPITQKEFYQLFAIFNNNAESGKGAEKAGNHEPSMPAPRPEDLVRLKELDGQIAAAERGVREKEQKLPELLARWESSPDSRKPGVGWTTADLTGLKSGPGSQLTKRTDKSIFVTKKNASTDPPSDEYTVSFKAEPGSLSAIRLEALSDDALPGKGPGRSANGNFVMTDFAVSIDGKPAKIASGSADFSQEKYPVANAFDTDKIGTGWAIHPNGGVSHQAIFAFDKPIASAKPMMVTVTMEFKSRFPKHALGRFRLSTTDSSAPHEAAGTPASVVAILNTPADKRNEKQRNDLSTYFREHYAGDLTDSDRVLARAKADKAAYESSIPTAMIMKEMDKPRETRILIRGQYDKPGEKVEMGLPRLFGDLPPGAPMNRLGLAMWMVKADNPLTSRVAVNRFWEMFFGTGIVKTTENFGSQADWPSHPELLDWLATEFVRTGWDMKKIQKEMVMSAAYRQSAKVTPELLEKDAENRLIARGPRFRLQAEMIRDQAMSIAGLLIDKIGGPSVRPYQPDGIWDEINVYGNLRNYKHDIGEGLHRRSLYTIWKRTSAPPGMTVFDMPGRETCTVKRSRTDTPLQALALMNDVTYLEPARVLAQRMINEGGASADARIAYAFQRALARPPTEKEVTILKQGLEHRLAKYKADPEAAKKLIAQGDAKLDSKLDPSELAAYTTTASVILNLDEVITRE